MSSLTRRPTSVRAVERVMGQLQATRARNRALKEEAKHATTPIVATASVQAGALAHGAAVAFFPGNADKVHLFGGVGAVVAGTLMDSPEAVLFGNGLLAPVVAQYGLAMFSRQG